eukprot:259477-Prymnesium_polylepis.1
MAPVRGREGTTQGASMGARTPPGRQHVTARARRLQRSSGVRPHTRRRTYASSRARAAFASSSAVPAPAKQRRDSVSGGVRVHLRADSWRAAEGGLLEGGGGRT